MLGFGCLIALHRSSSFLQSKFPPAPWLGRGENWPRRSAERSRVAGGPRGPGSVRPFRPRRRWGIGTQARSRRRSPWVRGCTAISVLAVVRVACVGRDVCRVHGCLRGRHGAAAGWVFEGVAFQCAHRGLRAAATKQAEGPGPRPGRDVSRHPKRGCETTAAQHTAQSLQRRRGGITPARRLPG